MVLSMAYRLIYPKRTYLIVSGRLGKEVNVMAADWVTVLSHKPTLIGVAVSPKRYTHKLVEKYGEYVIAVPGKNMLRDVWIAGSRSGPDKLSDMNITLIESKTVKTPSIKEALANIECKVVAKNVYGDHTFFVGEITGYTFNEEVFNPSNYEPRNLTILIAHIARNKFTRFSNEILTP